MRRIHPTAWWSHWPSEITLVSVLFLLWRGWGAGWGSWGIHSFMVDFLATKLYFEAILKHQAPVVSKQKDMPSDTPTVLRVESQKWEYRNKIPLFISVLPITTELGKQSSGQKDLLAWVLTMNKSADVESHTALQWHAVFAGSIEPIICRFVTSWLDSELSLTHSLNDRKEKL